MRFKKTTVVAVLLVPFALALAPPKEASAGGGYFPSPQPAEITEVAGHRMILSFSEDRTTLWDQISYVGSPESFAWVLPIKGMAQVGISSDALFNTLEAHTAVTVYPVVLSCPSSPYCAAGGVQMYPPVELPVKPEQSYPPEYVLAREVVGPYEMAQLSSPDASALQAWLAQNGYVIPAEVGPILSAYAAEGFNFLAIKLVPGQGVQSMKPVRVTTKTTGASPVLPLRMVAAGAGKVVPITLWTFGSETYLPSSSPWFTIPEDQLVWNWNKNESNYQDLRQAGLSATSNKGWLLAVAAEGRDAYLRQSLCLSLAKLAPDLSGYADEMGYGAQDACDDDLDALFRFEAQRRMTRLEAELPKEALSIDLTFMPTKNQPYVSNDLQIKNSVGTAPTCPSYTSCPPPEIVVTGEDSSSSSSSSSSGCACTDGGSADASTAPLGALLSLGWIMARRRKKADRVTLP